jgi:hypothetical protein
MVLSYLVATTAFVKGLFLGAGLMAAAQAYRDRSRRTD